jgi:hypothetical protein
VQVVTQLLQGVPLALKSQKLDLHHQNAFLGEVLRTHVRVISTLNYCFDLAVVLGTALNKLLCHREPRLRSEVSNSPLVILLSYLYEASCSTSWCRDAIRLTPSWVKMML